jgi:pimeloyl-ACP methyl ester carboxylesterase
MNTHTFTHEGRTTRYADAGASGLPIVLLHGFTERLELWEHCQHELAYTNRVIAPDMLGHGTDASSEAFSMQGFSMQDFSMQDMARHVVALLDHLHLAKAVWVGHSMGGYAAMQAMKIFPERVAALCLFHSAPFADSEEGRAARTANIALVREGKKEQVIDGLVVKTFAEQTRRDHAHEVESIRLQRLQTSDGGMIAALEAMRERDDTSHVLLDVEQPVMMFIGAEDQIVPVSRLLELLPKLKTGMACVVAGAAHMGMVEAPEKSIHAIRALVAMAGG